MEIRFLGQSCFRFRGKKAALATDPFGPDCGLKLAKIEADIITVSHQHSDHNFVEGVSGTENRGKPFVIDGPGEYEVAEISVFGLPFGKKKTIYLVEIDGLKLVHFGGLDCLLDEKKAEKINGVDILLIPVGGNLVLDAKQAVELTKKIQPKIVIPMHYQLPGLNYQLAPVDDFLKVLGEEKIEPVDSLTISRDRLPEERQLIIFNARN